MMDSMEVKTSQKTDTQEYKTTSIKWLNDPSQNREKGRKAFTSQTDNNLMHPEALEGYYQGIQNSGPYTTFNFEGIDKKTERKKEM